MQAEPYFCAHCQLPVPAGLVEEGEEQQFCCAACRTVYATLQEHGLQKFYALREKVADSPGAPAFVSGRKYQDFDHPDFLHHHVQVDGEISSIRLFVQGVHCIACVWLLEKLPQILPGVVDARLDLGRSFLELRWNSKQVPLSRIASALDRMGYTPHPMAEGEPERQRRSEIRREFLRMGVAAALALNVMAIAFALYGGYLDGMEDSYRDLFLWTSLLLTMISLCWPGRVFFRGAWTSMRTRTPHMDLPIALGLAGGFLGGMWNTWQGIGEVYFESVSILVFLLLVGRYIQKKQQHEALGSLQRLHALAPGYATRLQGELREQVPILSLRGGDRIEVLGGETIPADGVLVAGEAIVDAKILTGESKHQRLAPGAKIFAGCSHWGERIQIEVTAVGENSRVGKLLEMVQSYAQRKGQLLQMADRVAGIFTKVVVLLAVTTFVAWSWLGSAQALEHAVALLIVACPCALGLAAPLAVVAAVGRAARNGMLIKGGDVCERLAKVGVMVLDKTGTLSQGKVAVVAWEGDAITTLAVAALEQHASHPFAKAFVDLADGQMMPQAEDVRIVSGCGVEGLIEGVRYRIGSPKWMHQLGVPVEESELQSILEASLSPVVIQCRSRQGTKVWYAGIGDPLQANAAEVVSQLQQRGWQLHILSGDHPQVVVSVAKQLKLPAENCLGGLSPEEKVENIQKLCVRHSSATTPVVMVGDGWNDAAALAAADVGIAVHGSAEASLAAADVFLAEPGLGALLPLLEGSRRTVRLIRRNFAVSLAYNAVGVALAMAGLLNPLLAAVLMPLSSLTVVSLAWRTSTFPKP